MLTGWESARLPVMRVWQLQISGEELWTGNPPNFCSVTRLRLRNSFRSRHQQNEMVLARTWATRWRRAVRTPSSPWTMSAQRKWGSWWRSPVVKRSSLTIRDSPWCSRMAWRTFGLKIPLRMSSCVWIAGNSPVIEWSSLQPAIISGKACWETNQGTQFAS